MNLGRFPLPLPPATKILFLVNVAVFFANMLLFGRLSDPNQGAWLAFSWSGLLDGYGLGMLRIVSYQFTHSFASVMHVLMNMVALWVFGPMAESRLGYRGLLRVYLWGGFVGAVGHLLVAAVQGHADVPLVGASGACYALMVYAACVMPHASIVFMIVAMPLWLLATLFCFVGAYQLFVELATGFSGGVSHSAHLGGALFGLVAFRRGWCIDYAEFGGRPREGWLLRWRRAWGERRAARAAASRQQQELQLDAILAKVKAEGLGALRPEERQFLERISQRSRKPGS
jgi:membrane associated rhomboid family serine protease